MTTGRYLYGSGFVSPKQIDCPAPTAEAGSFGVNAAMNGHDYADEAFYYVTPIGSLLSYQPLDNAVGGTEIMYGHHFVNSLTCHFGNTTSTPATYVMTRK